MNLDQQKKQAREFLRAVRAGNTDALTRLKANHLRWTKVDDASVRRAANRSGAYARFEFTFPAAALKAGANTVSLHANRPSGANNGIMYDTVVLETD